MVQLRSWMIPAEACPGTFDTLKGACGKTTTIDVMLQMCRHLFHAFLENFRHRKVILKLADINLRNLSNKVYYSTKYLEQIL